jgi:hypothetical protein
MYDPTLGLFVSADSLIPEPADPKQFNRYSYAANNPLRYTDPSGHCHFDKNGNIDKWDCRVEDFDQMSIADRKRWVEQFMRQTGCHNCFNNILGVLDFFDAKGLAAPGSWLSMVDAAILQGISLGYGTYLNSRGMGPPMKNTNTGAQPWADFFDYRDKNPRDLSGQRQRWGAAEQAATDYGVSYAENGINPRTGKPYAIKPTTRESGLIQFTNIYRTAVRSGAGDLDPLFDPFDPNQRQQTKSLAVNYWDIMERIGIQ